MQILAFKKLKEFLQKNLTANYLLVEEENLLQISQSNGNLQIILTNKDLFVEVKYLSSQRGKGSNNVRIINLKDAQILLEIIEMIFNFMSTQHHEDIEGIARIGENKLEQKIIANLVIHTIICSEADAVKKLLQLISA